MLRNYGSPIRWCIYEKEIHLKKLQSDWENDLVGKILAL